MGIGRILMDILILGVIASTLWYIYSNYGEQIVAFLYGEQLDTIYINDLAVAVSVADEPAERTQGLSGVAKLSELEGKLFIFDEEDTYGIWMKDMLIPLDIIWINNQYEIVHIAANVAPDTYPQVFRPSEPARFVLEVNAFFSESFGVRVGDRVSIPAGLLPQDLKDQTLIDAGFEPGTLQQE